MANYVYAGPTALLGRFGTVTTGDIIDLTVQEVASTIDSVGIYYDGDSWTTF